MWALAGASSSTTPTRIRCARCSSVSSSATVPLAVRWARMPGQRLRKGDSGNREEKRVGNRKWSRVGGTGSSERRNCIGDEGKTFLATPSIQVVNEEQSSRPRVLFHLPFFEEAECFDSVNKRVGWACLRGQHARAWTFCLKGSITRGFPNNKAVK
ncbi:hypothetical protein BJY52DRAFT_691016 [Lactarius psammicola]|nr:hypothetical protein BJY52DRAFT_691016 [Lactarius psammicola]